jgi:hypothetical protein
VTKKGQSLKHQDYTADDSDDKDKDDDDDNNNNDKFNNQ